MGERKNKEKSFQKVQKKSQQYPLITTRNHSQNWDKKRISRACNTAIYTDDQSSDSKTQVVFRIPLEFLIGRILYSSYQWNDNLHFYGTVDIISYTCV